MGHPRVSGIREWLTNQQSGLTVTCFYPPDCTNNNTLTQRSNNDRDTAHLRPDDDAMTSSPSLGSLCVPTVEGGLTNDVTNFDL